MDLKLTDKVVLVTGGTGGIGKAIVKAFLDEGAKVAFSSTRQEKADALVDELGVEEGRVKGFVADMNKEEDIKALVEGAKEFFGTIDIVIPNAGYEGKAHPVQDMTLDLFEQTYMLNVFAVMLTMKYTAPILIENGKGAVVVIASAAAYEPTAGNSAYVSSKYAVAGLTKCVALELGPHLLGRGRGLGVVGVGQPAAPRGERRQERGGGGGCLGGTGGDRHRTQASSDGCPVDRATPRFLSAEFCRVCTT